jgi:acyl-homoserine-lactone acylase
MIRRLVLSALLMTSAPVASQQHPVYAPRQGTEILWDRFGVPHVFAKDSKSLFYAYGWAQMQAHGDLLLRLYAQARGRAAELWGESFLESDQWVRLNGLQERADRNYRLMRPQYRGYLDAFAGGMNAYANEHRSALDSTMLAGLPIRPVDVLAHTMRVLHLSFVTSRARIPGIVESWQRGGSNAWAIAPSRSTSGNALLLANPHLPWSDFFLWFEAQLVSSDINAYGAGLVGFPLIALGFNQRVGWTHTVNTIDAADVYELTLEPGGYRWNGRVQAFDEVKEPIRVKTDAGVRTDTFRVLRSVHGPVIASREGTALALRIAGLDQPHGLEQNWRMLRASNLREFETALQMLQLPMFTVIYADRDGHIMHLFNGRVPVRPAGDWAFWNRPVRGDTSGTLWTRTHVYAELPRVVDPPSGWVQNANDPPWFATLPLALDPARFPPYMAPRTPLSFRAQRSLRMISQDEAMTFEELIAAKHSTRLEAADHILDELIAATRRHGSERAQRAADVLARWDRSAEAQSRGTILFQAFMAEAARRRWPGNSIFAARFNENRPLTTPDGLSDATEAAAVLDAAAQVVEQRHGALDVAYGEVYRLRRDGVDLPANGGSGELGAFRVVDFEPERDRFVATGGDSFIAAIEFARPIRAQSLLPYGNASQPGSKHRTDQLEMFARKQLKPVWLRREDVVRNLESRKRF